MWGFFSFSSHKIMKCTFVFKQLGMTFLACKSSNWLIKDLIYYHISNLRNILNNNNKSLLHFFRFAALCFSIYHIPFLSDNFFFFSTGSPLRMQSANTPNLLLAYVTHRHSSHCFPWPPGCVPEKEYNFQPIK